MSLLEIIARVGDSFVVVVVSKETGYKKEIRGKEREIELGSQIVQG